MKKIERPPMKRAERVGHLIKQMFGQSELGRQLSRHQAWLIWDQLVGEQIAARARPLKLRQGVLEVQVDHPVWMQQLQMLKPQILKKLAAQAPEAGITDIFLRQSRGPVPGRPKKPQQAAPPPWLKVELTPAEKENIEKELAAVNNPELKNELRTLFTRQIQHQKCR